MAAKTLMIQGTMSNAGKSLLVAGICRIFARRGLKVAPFKSQNMALNSAVTADGFEMGRAQVMQAEAAGIAPDVRMNPVLLKPMSNTGSQVIVMGSPIGTMQAKAYYEYKPRLRSVVEDAFASLAAENDLIVIEGAGSPAEINLKQEDFVNMGMAKIANAPVLLAGDIDPGGVFAQIYGTVELLDETERKHMKGFIVNKFRGDVDILRPGIAPLEKMCGIPCVGIVPYMKVDIDDEDSLAMRLAQSGRHEQAEGAQAGFLDIAVIRLPHLSNFTDFNALERTDAISLRYVSNAVELGRPDMVILPGTKNTMGDLKWLFESGMASCIKALAANGTPIVGICGGYQMLGMQLADPDGVEIGGNMDGLGLLPLDTVFTPDKRLTQVDATFQQTDGTFNDLAGLRLHGYEIHMGNTTPVNEADTIQPAVELDAEPPRPDGAINGSVMGTYLHGLFDAPGVAEAVVKMLAKLRGLELQNTSQVDNNAYKQEQYNILADGMEASLDIDAIWKIIEKGV